MDSVGYMTCELKVETHSPGWHKTLIKVLKSIQGVSFTIDAERGVARVSGKIDPEKLLLMLAKAEKHADLLWLDSGNHYINTSTVHANVARLHDNNNNNNNNPHRNFPIAPDANGCGGFGYTDNYHLHSRCGAIDPYMDGPSPPRALYDDPHYPNYEQPARSFPQAPPPIPGARLESFCNVM